LLPMEFPNRGKDDPQAGSEQAEYSTRMDQLELDQQIKKEDEEWRKQQETDPIGQTDPHDFRSADQKRLGLDIGGNSWKGDEWRERLNEIQSEGGWQDSHVIGKQYNNRLPSSTDPDHPNYEGHFPDHWSNQPTGGHAAPKENPMDWSTDDQRVIDAATRAGKQYTERVEYANNEGESMYVELPVKIFKDAFGFSYGIDYDAAQQYGVPWGWQPRYIQGRVGFDPGE
jgi:hypothetical protein